MAVFHGMCKPLFLGLLALSLAVAPPLGEEGRYAEVPADAYPRIEQGGVLLSWAQGRTAAEARRAFVIGPKMPDRFAAVHASAAAPTDGETRGENLRDLRFTDFLPNHWDGTRDTNTGTRTLGQRNS